jgi:hypothetical protein
MSVGDLHAPGVTDGAKDFGPVLVARWVIPPDPANLVVERGRELPSCRHRGAAVHEHEFESFVRCRSGEVLEYQFNRSCLGRRGGNHSHTQR